MEFSFGYIEFHIFLRYVFFWLCLESFWIYMSETQGREVRAGDKNLEIRTQVGVKTMRG